jgi:hypothetical protein
MTAAIRCLQCIGMHACTAGYHISKLPRGAGTPIALVASTEICADGMRALKGDTVPQHRGAIPQGE